MLCCSLLPFWLFLWHGICFTTSLLLISRMAVSSTGLALTPRSLSEAYSYPSISQHFKIRMFFPILLFFSYVKQTTFWITVCGQCIQENSCALVWVYFGSPQLNRAKKAVRQGRAAKGPRAPWGGATGSGQRGKTARATSSCLKGRCKGDKAHRSLALANDTTRGQTLASETEVGH